MIHKLGLVLIIAVANLVLVGVLLLAYTAVQVTGDGSRCVASGICVRSDRGSLTVTWPAPSPTPGPYDNWYAQAYPTVAPTRSH